MSLLPDTNSSGVLPCGSGGSDMSLYPRGSIFQIYAHAHKAVQWWASGVLCSRSDGQLPGRSPPRGQALAHGHAQVPAPRVRDRAVRPQPSAMSPAWGTAKSPRSFFLLPSFSSRPHRHRRGVNFLPLFSPAPEIRGLTCFSHLSLRLNHFS